MTQTSEQVRSVVGYLLIVLLASALALACGPIRDQPSIRPQEAPRIQAPAGAVSTRGVERQYVLAEAQVLRNPLPPTAQSIADGEAVFKTYCVMCHGVGGKGDGPVGQYFDPRPIDLTAGLMDQLSDGQLFVMVTNGIGRMPPFRGDLTEEQRWQVVTYVRTLRR